MEPSTPTMWRPPSGYQGSSSCLQPQLSYTDRYSQLPGGRPSYAGHEEWVLHPPADGRSFEDVEAIWEAKW